MGFFMITRQKPYLRLVLGSALAGLILACNSSDFSSGSKNTREEEKKPAPETEKNSGTPTKPGKTNKTGGTNGSDPADEGTGGGSDGDTPGDDAGTDGAAEGEGESAETGDTGAATAGGIVTESEATCLLKKGDDFRIVFAFDNSKSTNSTDPNNIRRAAALRLVDQFADFAAANPRTSFKAATVAFNSTATTGAHGWVELTPASRADFEADITMATTEPAYGTQVDKAIKASDGLLQLDGASPADTRRRSYVILLSDGEANGPLKTINELTPLATSMVDTRGTAIYSIIIGKGSNNGAMSLMKALALPSVGQVGPDHVGVFVHAPDPAAIDQAFVDFFKRVTGC